jgi:hypothetical protein
VKWATRANLHIDRAACIWLIRRAVDPAAEFVFVADPAEVPADATAFDMRGVGTRALSHPLLVALAVAAFLALALFGIAFPIVIAAAALAGWAIGHWKPGLLANGGHGKDDDGPAPLIADDALHHDAPSAKRAIRIIAPSA